MYTKKSCTQIFNFRLFLNSLNKGRKNEQCNENLKVNDAFTKTPPF